MKFKERTETKKGTVGEELIQNWLEKHGLVLYEPVGEKAHLIDFFAVDKNTCKTYIVEVKTKAKRLKYDDTGINQRNFLEYIKLSKEHNMRILLIFVDEENGLIYGNFLDQLEQPIKYNNKMYPYDEPNSFGPEIHYWPLSRMHKIEYLSADVQSQLKKLTTKQPMYITNGNQARVSAILGTQLNQKI